MTRSQAGIGAEALADAVIGSGITMARLSEVGDLPTVGCRWAWTPRSGNSKTGPIGVSRQSPDTCPSTCPLIDAGCYGELGHTMMHWRKLGCLSDRGSGAGRIAWRALRRIGRWASDTGAVVWTYTHHKGAIMRRAMTIPGLTVRVSCESEPEARRHRSHGRPVALVGPSDLDACRDMVRRLDDGVICPAAVREGVTCEGCAKGKPLCARRDLVIIFPAHGARKRTVSDLVRIGG